ncbi:MAG TPA: VOC family protein [Mucilaginibacter sp.]
MKVIPYLNFEGRTEEVINTYRDIFNGNIESLMRFGDRFPGNEDRIMHATLSFSGNNLMFSDGKPGDAVNYGNGLHLCISLSDEAEATRVFNTLSDGGKVTMPLEKQFWGALYGQVIDRFGVSWMINCQ